MANFCDFRIVVKGTETAVKLVYMSMPCLEEKDIEAESGSSEEYMMQFSGSTKWSVNFGTTDIPLELPDDIDQMSDDELEEYADDIYSHSLRAKSEMLDCEIQVHYWSEESGFNQFDQYVNGVLVKARKIAYEEDADVMDE